MKKYLLIALLGVLIIGTGVYASDVTNAKYLSTVTVTNTGAEATDIPTVFDLPTDDMIDGLLLSDNASDCAMQSGGGGSDIAFMPGWDTNPWCTWVSSIGDGAQATQYLYHKDATGGKIRYYSGGAGMSVNDHATLEGGDNFTITSAAFYETGTSALNNAFISKSPHLWAGVTDSGYITAALSDADDSIEQAAQNFSYDVYSGSITRVGQKLPDDFTGYITSVQFYLEKTGNPTGTGYASVYAGNTLLINIGTVDVSTLGAAAWKTFNTSPVWVVGRDNVRVVFRYEGGDASNKIAVYLQATDVADGQLTHFQTATWTDNAAADCTTKLYWKSFVVVKAEVASGEHTVAVTANTSTWALYVDDVLGDDIALGGAALTDNTSAWYFNAAAVTPYMEYTEVTVDGAQAGYWGWEYAATFTDQSVNSNTATPTFRTTSGDADVSAEVTELESLLSSTAASGNVTGGWTMIADVPPEPTNLFAEGGDSYGLGELNIGEQVTAAAEEAGQDATSWHIILVFAVALMIMIGVYKLTHNTKMGQRGSLFIATIGAEAVLIFFYIMETIPGLALIPFGLIALLMIVWRKSPSPVD